MARRLDRLQHRACHEPVRPSTHFTGKERDSESGLDYFGARYYGSALGRFTSPDPKIITKQRVMDPQQWNRYSYTRNNPLQFIDPDGKELKLAIYGVSGTVTKTNERQRSSLDH